MSAQEETVSTTTDTAVDPNATPSGAAGSEAPNDGAQASDRDEKGRFKNPLQPRINELTRKAHDADREAAYWRARAETAEKPKEEAKAPEKPKVESFENYGDYVEALADWKADQKIEAARKADREERAAERESETRASTWSERAANAAERIPDFKEVMGSDAARSVRISDAVKDALSESDRGPELAYALVKDPSIADKLNRMTPQRAAIELGRMEAALPAVSAEPDPEEVSTADDTPAPPPAPVRKTTSAPPPVKPIANKGASTKTDLSKMSMDDYVNARKSQGARWARR